MEKTDASRLFAELFVNTDSAQFSPELVEAARTQILDYFAVCLTGAGKDGARQVRELAIEMGGRPDATILGAGVKVPAPNAAQANATAAHSLDFDDVHEAAIMHPGVVTVSTALAVGEMTGGISGRDLIAAVILGGDMICRLGLATHPEDSNIHKYGWHMTSLYSAMTSAAVASRIMGLSVEETVSAMGIAYHQAAGNGQAVKDSALTKRLGPGMGIRDGIHSAMLAQKGVTGAVNSLEGVQGLFNTYHQGMYSHDILVGGLGERFETLDISIKPYPACRGTHPSIDSSLKLYHEHGVRRENVRHITIEAGKATIELLGDPLEVKARPRTVVDAQFSFVWGAATAITKGKVTLDDYTDEAIVNPDVLEVASKISVVHNPEMDTGGLEPVRVTVETTDGRTLSVLTKEATGSPEKPVTFPECARKFRECVSCAQHPVSAQRQEQIISAVAKLDQLESISDLIALTFWED